MGVVISPSNREHSASLLLDMAHLKLLLGSLLFSTASAVTCPGFPGYCSESFPGQTCNVVCSTGRNNVPLCQEDGTWTDIPRCIEHEPGVKEQIPGICPGIPGYCAQGFLNHKCQFDCPTGIDINSICTSDGTWQPYPVCDGDLRETQDGCDGCPGPNGRSRNRTAEAILASKGLGPKPVANNRVPKTGSIDSQRKRVPSFAGSIQIGSIPANQPHQPLARGPPAGNSLFNQIKNNINNGNRQRAQQQPQNPIQPVPAVPQPRPTPRQQPQAANPSQQTFGPFEAVNLGNSLSGTGQNLVPSPQPTLARRQQQARSENFFGEFPTVNLQV